MKTLSIRYAALLLMASILFVLASPVSATPGALTTIFEPADTRTTLAPDVGYMFDVTAFNTLQITSFDLNLATAATYNFRVYYKAGSYVGSENNAGAWTLLGIAPVPGMNVGNPSNLSLGGLIIPAGQTYGLYVVVDSFYPAMVPTLSANTYANVDMQIDAGIELSEGAPGQFFGTGGMLPNRTFNGTIHYDTIIPGVPTAPVVEPAFTVPNLSEVMVTNAQTQPVYMSPAGQIIRNVDGSLLQIPQDFDGNGFDTYLVTETTIINDETWLAIFIGSRRWVWIPLADLTLVRPLPQ